MLKLRDHDRPLPEIRVTGSAVAKALLGDVEEMASLINHLSMAGDTGLPEDMAAYVPRPHRVICAEYLELMARKLREEKD